MLLLLFTINAIKCCHNHVDACILYTYILNIVIKSMGTPNLTVQEMWCWLIQTVHKCTAHNFGINISVMFLSRHTCTLVKHSMDVSNISRSVLKRIDSPHVFDNLHRLYGRLLFCSWYIEKTNYAFNNTIDIDICMGKTQCNIAETNMSLWSMPLWTIWLNTSISIYSRVNY